MVIISISTIAYALFITIKWTLAKTNSLQALVHISQFHVQVPCQYGHQSLSGNWAYKMKLKIKILCDFLKRGVVLTKDKLARRNWNGNNSCVFIWF
jgi:hypothetical protein